MIVTIPRTRRENLDKIKISVIRPSNETSYTIKSLERLISQQYLILIFSSLKESFDETLYCVFVSVYVYLFK